MFAATTNELWSNPRATTQSTRTNFRRLKTSTISDERRRIFRVDLPPTELSTFLTAPKEAIIGRGKFRHRPDFRRVISRIPALLSKERYLQSSIPRWGNKLHYVANNKLFLIKLQYLSKSV